MSNNKGATVHITKTTGPPAAPRRIGPMTPNKELPRASHKSMIGGGMEYFLARALPRSGNNNK